MAYSRYTEKPWGSELCFTEPMLPYCGKFIRINEGARLSLQWHDQKVETWTLLRGAAKVVDGNGDELMLEPGKGYTCYAGQVHRLVGLSDCEILEVSSPEEGVTYRLEDDYGRSTGA